MSNFDRLMDQIEQVSTMSAQTNNNNNSLKASGRLLWDTIKTTVSVGAELANETVRTGGDLIKITPAVVRAIKAFTASLNDNIQAYFNGLTVEEQRKFMESYNKLSNEQKFVINKQRSDVAIESLMKVFQD